MCYKKEKFESELESSLNHGNYFLVIDFKRIYYPICLLLNRFSFKAFKVDPSSLHKCNLKPTFASQPTLESKVEVVWPSNHHALS